MIIDILKTNDFKQANTGDTQGTIWSSKGVDPELNRGKINISKVMGYNANTELNPNLGEAAAAFCFSSSFVTDRYFAVADDRMWHSVNTNPTSGWSEVSGTPTDCDQDSDLIDFNSKVYIATSNYLKSYDGSNFANINALTANPHSICIYANRLYVSDGQNVESMNSSEAYVTSGSYTIDVTGTTGTTQQITKISPVSNGIWIATTYNDRAGGEMIFWDGVTANIASARYKLSRGALAMTIKDDRPYIMDSAGILRVFDGTTFSEVNRLPLKDEQLNLFNANDNTRFVHPNGMITVGDEIYMLLNNLRDDTDYNIIENLPAGIWAWNSRNGLYHKYPFYATYFSDSTSVDYGAFSLARTGALFQSNATGGSVVELEDQSEILAGIKYYTDATTTSGAIGIVNTVNTLQKSGYFVTAQIQSSQITESWENVVALYDKFKNATDKIIIKYRTSEDSPTYATGTWTDDDILRSSTDLSSVDDGDEVEILNGKGAGLCTHIKSITHTSDYRITIDETFSGVSGTCKFRVQKWRKCGTIQDTTQFAKRFSIDTGASAWIQFKVFMIGTGRSPQLQRLVSVSEAKTNYKQ